MWGIEPCAGRIHLLFLLAMRHFERCLRFVQLPAHHAVVAERWWQVGKDRVQRIWRRRAESAPETSGARAILDRRWFVVCAVDAWDDIVSSIAMHSFSQIY